MIAKCRNSSNNLRIRELREIIRRSQLAIRKVTLLISLLAAKRTSDGLRAGSGALRKPTADPAPRKPDCWSTNIFVALGAMTVQV
jgi:hypothetical protein